MLTKETSERSDAQNWAKRRLQAESGYFLESIEGCNQNRDDACTHLMERARITVPRALTKPEAAEAIVALEGEAALQRKLRFAARLHLPLHYVLYRNETERVLLLEIRSLDDVQLTESFASYAAFGAWLADIKGWKSTKAYREAQDLPYFDRALRQAGTPWPTNVDCFVSDPQQQPIALIEFQNSGKHPVETHSSNYYYLCGQARTQRDGSVRYHDDIRRWTSQEILRVQSGLRLWVITWSQHTDDFMLKQVKSLAIPYFSHHNGRLDRPKQQAYKRALHAYVNGDKGAELRWQVANHFQTYTLHWEANRMQQTLHAPPLLIGKHTFPWIYYRRRRLVRGDRSQLTPLFQELMAHP
ncbi:hypothetical protein SAMN05421823_105262 [Catalinimonas alkaloidigena]|uniref:Uncharacterized protein n=1 Tax=Catalinimonas alkaloidigena TaxID=1075417 RepID=A0A1G9JBZ1_9BACT|nr:hypothetical protein [Catalinimonas alkaloidigena]SDL34703.1 hypothetical protein SAMN05421823_105262 [Catalinimonas alkaloidigena]